LLLYLIYLSYLSNVYRACSFFTNLDLFCIDTVLNVTMCFCKGNRIFPFNFQEADS